MAESHLVSFKNIYPEIKKRHPLFSLNDIIEDETLNQINAVINDFSSNMYALCVQYVSSLKEAKSKILNLENKCASLEVKLNESKQTSCLECSKLRKELENFKNNKMDMMSNKTLFTDGSDNYTPEKKLSPDYNISNVENTVIPTKPYLQTSDDTIKTPPSTNKKRDSSPIVQKQTRSGKRKALFMSSKRRSRLNDSTENHKSGSNCSEILAHETLPEFEQKSFEDCVTPINDTDLSDDNMIEPSPLPVSKNNRKVNSFFSEKKIHELENFDSDSALNPLSINILQNYEGITNDENENSNKPSKKQKTVWNLKKSRGISNDKKFKQTLLSTAVFSKPLDISTLDEFQGGLPLSEGKTSQTITAPDDMELTNMNSSFDIHIPKLNSSEKENQPNPIVIEKNFDSSQETFFDPEIKLDKECKKPVTKGPVEKDSFDYIPEVSKSPNYKYRRNAVRKKAERQKLPGRECKNCCDFFIPNKKEPTNSQLNLINKFSRHRDKYPIISHTPPGLWNPKFSDTDDETD